MIVYISKSTGDKYRDRTMKSALFGVVKKLKNGSTYTISKMIDCFGEEVTSMEKVRMSLSKVCKENNIIYKTKVNKKNGLEIFVIEGLIK